MMTCDGINNSYNYEMSPSSTSYIPTEYTVHSCGMPHYSIKPCAHSLGCGPVVSQTDRVFGHSGVFNYSTYRQHCTGANVPVACTIEDVISKFPKFLRSCGRVVTFVNTSNSWELWQFVGTSITQWGERNCWENMKNQMGIQSIPDEEIDEIANQ